MLFYSEGSTGLKQKHGECWGCSVFLWMTWGTLTRPSPHLLWVGLTAAPARAPRSSWVPGGPSCLGHGIFLALIPELTRQQLLVASG